MVKNTMTVMDKEITLSCYTEYIVKKKQYLESSGIVTIHEPGKIMILSAVISGICNMQNVTDVIIKHVGQSDKPFINEEGHPMNKVYIDTGKLNIFTCGDINPGIQKLLQVVYVTEKSSHQEQHNENKHDCNCDCLDVICHPKKVHEYYCDYINDERYICFNEEVIDCKQHVARCLEKDCHCNDKENDCEKKRQRRKRRKRKQKCDKRKCGNKRDVCHCDCSNQHVNNCVKKNSMLIIPLYPIHKPYICHQKCKC